MSQLPSCTSETGRHKWTHVENVNRVTRQGIRKARIVRRGKFICTCGATKLGGLVVYAPDKVGGEEAFGSTAIDIYQAITQEESSNV